MDIQIARKDLQVLTFKLGNTANLSKSEETRNYCQNLFTPKRLTTFYNYNEKDSVTYCGRSRMKQITEFGECLTYTKCIFKSSVYHSIEYSRAKKTDDTIIELVSGNFCRIIDIIDKNGMCYLYLSQIHVFIECPFEGITLKKFEVRMK